MTLLTDTLAKCLEGIEANQGLQVLTNLFGNAEIPAALKASVLTTFSEASHALRLPERGAAGDQHSQGLSSLIELNQLRRQYDESGRRPDFVAGLITAANSSWTRFGEAGDAASVVYVLSAAMLVLAFQERARGSKRELRPAASIVVPDTINDLRNSRDRLRAWNLSRFSEVRHHTKWNYPGDGEIAYVKWYYLFEGAEADHQTDIKGEGDGSKAMKRSRDERIATEWARIQALFVPAYAGAEVLERWARSVA